MAVQGFIVTPYLVPAARGIGSITNAFPAVVTTTLDHGYITGAIVRLYIPSYCGMTQANRLKGSIEVTGATTFLIDIDTTLFDAYVAPAANLTPAQVVPIGEDTDTFESAFRNILQPLF